MKNQMMRKSGKSMLFSRTLLVFFGVLILQFCTSGEETFTIHTIGDSTMADKRPAVYPETGWCQVLGHFLDESVRVKNHARNGRSSKSFIEEGRWQAVLDSLKAGDFVFIQFGHNDEKEYDSSRYTTPFGTYTANLELFIFQTRDKGATPILFTSIVRRKFGEDGKLVPTHGDYPDAVRQVAEKLDVQLVDLQKLTEEWVNGMGDEASKEMFLWVPPGENYPEGKEDNTHLSEKGAYEVAKLALSDCIRLDVEFANKIELDQE